MPREVKSLARVTYLMTANPELESRRLSLGMAVMWATSKLLKVSLPSLIINKTFSKGGPRESHVTFSKNERTNAVTGRWKGSENSKMRSSFLNYMMTS